MRCAITRAIIAGVSSLAAGNSQSPCGRIHSPFSSNLPTTRGRTSVAPVVELLLQLVFDDLPLFLDDQDLVEAFGEVAHAFGLKRPRHRDLEHADADLRGVGFADAEVVERLAHVEIALARGDDAQSRLRAIDDDAVELIGPAVVQRGVDLEILHPRFGGKESVGPADVHAVRWEGEIVGHRQS